MKGKFLIGLVIVLASCISDYGVSPQETFDKQLSIDVSTIDQYLVDHGITNAIKDASGVRVVIHSLGTLGLPPNSGNDLVINYTGKYLSNGTQFASGTISERLSEYMIGWQVGLRMLPAGSVATLYIPSGWAYGASGNGTIPPNANLVFDIELESVVSTDDQLDQFTADVLAIDTYIQTNSISAIEYDSGMWYNMDIEGTGAMPTLYDQVKISFKGKLVSNGSVFVNEVVMPSSTFSSRVVNFPHGVQIGLQLLKVGGKATFYVPSGLAYGPSGAKNSSGAVIVPANANVIFEVELLEILN
jgi:FKBP-type peptidyl-prolyl cis-trans isomerase